jgi:formylglycine-generating enzyme required for sulfatase activity
VPDSIRFWKTRIEKMDADSSFSVGLIYGPSGCGKSSLVKAGLLPRLAKPVRVVYIEATGEETEARLLKGLRRQLPDLPGNLSLSESLAGLRRGRYLEAGQKVLLVLDQFEQWLHAKRNEENTDLVQALLQCDGGRAQAIVLVRDDFWLAVSRFMQALESRVVEGENSRLVDLFDPRHATKVLTAFGRAFEALSEKELTKEQDAFLDQAVAGLAQDGKVISVRLALFAEMVKGKPWTPATLREVGGTEGVGVTFLDETFTASTAPPRHRLHQKAAPAVLKALLPESGTDIKGHMRSQQELLEASGYASRPKDFDDLLRILDRELRLITPTDPEGKEDADTSTLPAGAKYYQLTHDYLVPSLRDWLTRKQKETRRGRAELLLADRAALWNARPENRQLPSLLQWLQVRWLTAKKHWTLPQRRMMRKAGRYHAKRGLLLTLLVLVATSCGLGAYLYTNQANHAAGLVRLLETADIAQVPGIVEELEPYRYWANARLKEANHKAAPGSRQKLNTSIALLPVQADEAEYLYDRLLDAELEFGQLQDPKPNVVRVILDSAAKHPAQGEHRERILLRLGAEVGASPQPNAKEDVKEKVAKRQAKAAVALLRMGQPEKVWRLLKHSADPRVRSYLIHLLGPSGVDFKVIRQQLKPQSSEVTIRRALLLSLGEFREEDIAADERDALVNDLRAWYTDDADPGIHGAIEWLLRKWKHGQWLKETNEQWASRKRRREERLESIRRGLANPGTGDLVPQWYVNSQGQTMVVIPSSVEFSVGSPLTEDGRWDDERPQQRQRIGHHFAITAKSVTVDQVRNFLKNHNPRSSHEPDCPVSMLSWYKAAEYCNWLSDQEGLERCYEPNEEGKYDVGMKPLPDCLDRTGYRLPTEEEWECACRAGAVTSRYYGESVELLRKYGRYVENSSNRSGNVATLKPNDWGLFDMHGNVWNWCQDRYEPSKTEKRIFRGGSYVDAADDVRAARRLKTNPDTPTRYVGLRPARTLR